MEVTNKQFYKNVQQYFKINFYLSLLSLLTDDVSNRFSENDPDILQPICERYYVKN